MEREVAAVIRENEGKAAPHRLHLDPDEIRSSRHHHLKAVPGDESDDSDEWDLDESETEWDGPGDGMYRDYRRMQRSTFLVAHLEQRIACVKAEMERWRTLMDKMMEKAKKEDEENEEEVFGIDCHDLSLENIFVGVDDPTTIVRIFFSTTIFIILTGLYRRVSLTGNRPLHGRSGLVRIYPRFYNPVRLLRNYSGR